MAYVQQQDGYNERLPSGVYFSEDGVRDISVNAHIISEFPVFRERRGATEPVTQCLPLLEVSVDVRVSSTVCRTALVQTFTNFASAAIPEAHYSFPLYDGAAVTSFKCHIGQDRVLQGYVKAKGEAKAEYQRAAARKEVA